MSESTAGDVPVENPQHASAPEAPDRAAPETREDTPDLTGAVPPEGPDPDADGEDRFDAG
ncbi:hypothetical protein M3148_07780 [Georgenia satyanarayanai]|uniref:hypothetical protein n=1 Tax=Georgenia satyanarayanai TaxID=860221 RepID=UPI00203E83BD|nr:hypothetical protein [Georgenia satyanarayanai]MCM3660891.1 hypothetical protein [Georgenia satyanarayanai]